MVLQRRFAAFIRKEDQPTMNRVKWLLPLSALTLIACCLAPATAQDEDLANEVAEKMAAAIQGLESMHTIMKFGVTLNGQTLPMNNLGMEMWVKRNLSVRTEMQFPPVVNVMTPTGAVIYNGMAGAALVIPEETMTLLSEKRNELLQQAGLNTDPMAMFNIFAKPGLFTVEGDVTVDERDCWQLRIHEDALVLMVEIVQNFMPGMAGPTPKFNSVAMAVDKEEAMMRQMDIDMVMAMPNGIEMDLFITLQVEETEINVDLPDALFEFEVPDDAKIIEWTPDRSADEVLAEFQGLAMQGMQ